MSKTSLISRIENAEASDLLAIAKDIKKVKGLRGIELCDLFEDACYELGYDPEEIMYNGNLVKNEA